MLEFTDNLVYNISLIIQISVFVVGCYFFSISIIGLAKKDTSKNILQIPQKKFALVVAAHNEEFVISQIIDSLKEQNYPKKLYDIYVIADNCTDNTSRIARDCGAIVYERSDILKKGKGYALDWIFSKIIAMGDKYDAVCIFDADNVVSSSFLIEINNKLVHGYEAIQGYIDSKNPFDSWITCSYSIAFWLANRMFQFPRHKLGLSCSLCGTGFCITVNILKKVGWGATCLTEDLEYTMKLALSNIKVAWAQNAIVYDEKPISLRQSWNQRKRWMQGHADCATRFLKPLFNKAFIEGNLVAFDCSIYLFQPVRFIFIGIITMIMWIQTIFPKSPFYNFKYAFPYKIWLIFILFQILYGPIIILFDKKLDKKLLLGFLLYPLYCITWLPITIQGFLNKNNKLWSHTLHTRGLSITDLEK